MPPRLQLVNADRLLEIVWTDESSRPSLRWLREMTRLKVVPHVRIGRLVWFDPEQVVEWIQNSRTVKRKP